MILKSPAASPIPVGPYPEFDVIVRSSVYVDRNVSEARLQGTIGPEESCIVSELLSTAARSAGMGVASTGSLDTWFRSNLVERGMYTRPYLLDDDTIVALSAKIPAWLVFNEKNHLSIREAKPGLALEAAWNDVSALEDSLSMHIGNHAWGFDADLGYIMGEAAFCGSGLAASVILHTPALLMSGLAETAFKKAMEAGFIVSGSYSVHAPSTGALFELALPVPYRDAERAALGRLVSAALALADYERRARSELMSKSPWELLDVAGRALGRTLGAWLVSRDEAADIVSGLRLGLTCGIMEGPGIEVITDLWSTLGVKFLPDRDGGTDENGSEYEPEAARRASALRHAAAGARLSKRYTDV
jgi:protein-arginine kinase